MPGTVKSCSRTVERQEVRRAENRLLLVPDTLLPLPEEAFDTRPKTASLCIARLPSLMATAAPSLLKVVFRFGSGTGPVSSEPLESVYNCSLASVLASSGSAGAYLSARLWIYDTVLVLNQKIVVKAFFLVFGGSEIYM